MKFNLLPALLRGIKAQYRAADAEGRRAILLAFVGKVVLRPDDSYMSWHEPVGMLFETSRVIGKSGWRQRIRAFITFVRHLTMRPLIRALKEDSRPRPCLRRASSPPTGALKQLFKDVTFRPEESR